MNLFYNVLGLLYLIGKEFEFSRKMNMVFMMVTTNKHLKSTFRFFVEILNNMNVLYKEY